MGQTEQYSTHVVVRKQNSTHVVVRTVVCKYARSQATSYY